MGIYAHNIQTLGDLFVHGVRDIFYAENAIAKALPRMMAKATDWDLKHVLETHLLETTRQIRRLEELCTVHGAQIRIVKCPAIDGIIKESNDITANIVDKEVLDAALIAAARAMEHYQITRYGALTTWALRLGRPDCAAPLKENLEEEEMADDKLAMLAQRVLDLRSATVCPPSQDETRGYGK
ncbi:ferritin-like domain-containing protein [Niveispirillum sp. KHB5.9]|uniref:YciE/YciF ferroxidase family protein n=1 Tax=Niveispirillum sp. KHB5.9 TaxID=3400269 RepID=UPI003A8B3892